MEKLFLGLSVTCLLACIFAGILLRSDILEKGKQETEYTKESTLLSETEGEAFSSCTDLTSEDNMWESLFESVAETVTDTEENSEQETSTGAENTDSKNTDIENTDTDFPHTETITSEEYDTETTSEPESSQPPEDSLSEDTEQTEDTETSKVSNPDKQTSSGIESDIIAEEPEETPVGVEIPTSIKLPILMYHALTTDPALASDTTVTVEAFEEQIATLTALGYTSIFFGELRDYVKNGKPLPEKPIMITFDDGYSSNLELGGPILSKYGQKATVSVIGISVGKDTYKDTDIPILPHFSYEEARLAYEGGIFDFQSHTYDMHQREYEEAPRHGMLQKEGESEEEYIASLKNDFALSKQLLEEGVGNEVFVIIYPHGKRTELTDSVLKESGAEISVTVEKGINFIKFGDTECLRELLRINMDDSIGRKELESILQTTGERGE